MQYTLEMLNKIMMRTGGSLYLDGCTGLTALPDNLPVVSLIYLDGCTGLTELPDNLPVVSWISHDRIFNCDHDD